MCRYSGRRRASVEAALQPALLRWHRWARACAHHRRYQQQAALQAWRELLQLQTQLFLKVGPASSPAGIKHEVCTAAHASSQLQSCIR